MVLTFFELKSNLRSQNVEFLDKAQLKVFTFKKLILLSSSENFSKLKIEMNTKKQQTLRDSAANRSGSIQQNSLVFLPC